MLTYVQSFSLTSIRNASGNACPVWSWGPQGYSILEKDLEIVHAPPAIEPGSQYDEYRQGVFNLYLPMHAGIPRWKRKTHAKMRFIWSYFLNGDLTSPAITHYCARGCCETKASCRQTVAHFPAWALVPRKLPVLSRMTWTSFHDSLAWTEILASHHGISAPNGSLSGKTQAAAPTQTRLFCYSCRTCR